MPELFTQAATGFEDLLGGGFLQSLYGWARIIFIILDILLLGVFAVGFRQAWKYRPDLDLRPPTSPKVGKTLQSDIYLERWRSILNKTAGGSADAMRIAVIEADALTDNFLREIGLAGEHMADRLTAMDPNEVKNLNRLWQAHRTRNDLVHTPGFYLSPEDARRVLDSFHDFLQEMGAFG